jgi:hypothetical protein
MKMDSRKKIAVGVAALRNKETTFTFLIFAFRCVTFASLASFAVNNFFRT